jgi:MraZ protein
MFRGIHTSTLDAKGRLGLPVRVRETLGRVSGADVIATIDTQERCLLLYPLAEWEIVQARVQELANLREAARLLQRLLIGHATDLQIDGNGRILLPSMLREYAGLDKGAVIVGQSNKFEIWSESHWHTRREFWLTNNREALSQASEAVLDVRV